MTSLEYKMLKNAEVVPAGNKSTLFDIQDIV